MLEPENILLVEGIDDLHLIAHLLKHYGHEGVIHIEKRDGISKLLKSLRTVLKRWEVKRLGIVVDFVDLIAYHTSCRMLSYHALTNMH